MSEYPQIQMGTIFMYNMNTQQSKLKKLCEFFNALLQHCSECAILGMHTWRVHTP